VLGDELPVKLLRKVFEFGVGCADEIQFLLATPALELLLAANGHADVTEVLVVEQPYFLEKPSKLPFLCCRMRVSNSLVTPMYNVPVWLPMM
jgi:hypothetical protein